MAGTQLAHYPLFGLLVPATRRLACRGAREHLRRRRDDLSGELPRGVGLSRRAGRVRILRRSGPREITLSGRSSQATSSASMLWCVQVSIPRLAARRRLQGCFVCRWPRCGFPPGHESRLEQPEELAAFAYLAALPPRAGLSGLHVGGVGLEVARPSEADDLSGRADDPGDRTGGGHLARDRPGHRPTPRFQARCRGRGPWPLRDVRRARPDRTGRPAPGRGAYRRSLSGADVPRLRPDAPLWSKVAQSYQPRLAALPSTHRWVPQLAPTDCGLACWRWWAFVWRPRSAWRSYERR